MKKNILIILLSFFATDIFASHIIGGEVFYTYLGPGTVAGTSKYQINLRLFRNCNVPCGTGSVACLPQVAIVSVFVNTSPYTRIKALSVPLKSSQQNTLQTYPVCISGKPSVCYEVKTYFAQIILTDNDVGYIIAYQNCCRAPSYNVTDNAATVSGTPGVTYDCTIPGKNKLPSGYNSSAVFGLKDTTLVCYSSAFTLDFSAVDPDKDAAGNGDSLSYQLTPAYQSDPAFTAAQDGLPALNPPYSYVFYNSGFNGAQPLGDLATIDGKTGIISGISPEVSGNYVVNVIVNEWRNGVLIATHRKDFIMHVADCTIPVAELKPSYITCDGFNLSFSNLSTAPNINSYYWDFGVTGIATDTSINPTPDYSYTDSGTYTVTLITNKGSACSDTATTLAKVYPGFIPDFSINGSCILNAYKFTDKTTSKYGKVDTWSWDFGDSFSTADTSHNQNDTWKYNDVQSSNVTLIVTNSKGCVDTLVKPFSVSDVPGVQLKFKDTLICVSDTLQLQAGSNTSGITYSWSPATNINNTKIANPLVSPNVTTNYTVTIDDKGCIGTDSVKVNVIPFVTLNIGADTTICLTDQLQMQPATNALYFTWSPGTGVSDTTIKNPFIQPIGNSNYKLVASVGKCSATDDINLNTVPYPQVAASADTTICFGQSVDISAVTNAPIFAWSPTNSLTRFNTLNPTATPVDSVFYTITVQDPSSGCPKPSSDQVVVTALPRIMAFAGYDTTIVINQPLQLNATGGAAYAWSPSTGMNNTNIFNPIVIISSPDTITYHVIVSVANCTASDDIKVTIFKTLPDIFVPSAFTPNNDQTNDLLRAKVLGMKQFNYFRVYNRWGQMLFSTSTLNQGWNGRYGGVDQPSGTYIYVAQAIDYTGKVFDKKGTAVLIR